MTSRTAQKRTNGSTPQVESRPKLQLLRVAVQWTAVYIDGDEPPEEITSQPFNMTARDWPGVVGRIDGDLGRILEQIVAEGGFEAFQQKMVQEQAQQQRPG